MNRFEISLQKYKKALDTLKLSLDTLYSEDLDIGYEEFIKDSVVQRFEYTTELMWKTIKEYLDLQHGIDCVSPKSCLKNAFKVGLINDLDKYFEMIYVRNLSSHTYNQEQIENIITEIDGFLAYFDNIYEKLTESS